MKVYKLLKDKPSVSHKYPLYAKEWDFCRLISTHDKIAILERLKVVIEGNKKVYLPTGVTFSMDFINLAFVIDTEV